MFGKARSVSSGVGAQVEAPQRGPGAPSGERVQTEARLQTQRRRVTSMVGKIGITRTGYDPEAGKHVKDPYLGPCPALGACRPDIREQLGVGDTSSWCPARSKAWTSSLWAVSR